eukprot:CAMPEP_0172043706 /NCGR_PEP_ID=MMETSP1041-20130122/26406_1 /TAXON_ID=464988 /ORGANISM="Hemiselmis andersenii, Strain CCMP439" /LENGTH=837 /DNA_ID=CAMNT_0012702151 /DNA_START=40 /DNA_END=2553 /DNA_ORIENTATION=+
MGHGEHDSASLVAHAEDGHVEGPGGPSVPTETELQEVGNLQAELASMQARMWSAEDVDEEEAEELERKQTLLKIKLAQASDAIKEWGMTTGLEKMIEFENMHKKWHDDKPVDETRLIMSLVPIACLFMFLVFGASYIHFSDAKPIPGELYAVDAMAPLVWPLAGASYMIEARIQIPSTAGPADHGHGGEHHRRTLSSTPLSNKPSYQHGLLYKAGKAVAESLARGAAQQRLASKAFREQQQAGAPSTRQAHGHGDEHGDDHSASSDHGDDDHAGSGGHSAMTRPVDPTPHPDYTHPIDLGPGNGVGHDPNSDYITVYLMEMRNQACVHAEDPTWEQLQECAVSSVEVGDFQVRDVEENKLLELQITENPVNTVMVIRTDSIPPLPVAIQLHSLGWLGPYQVGIAALIMAFVFSLITTEALHRTMAAMIGAAMTLVVLALQNRVPSLSTVVGWMDHGTLGLLWGMMLIVGITMRTGVFEWTGVLACKLSGGDKTKLLLLLCLVTAVLSAFLDNVTTILLIAPVTCKLCKLVGIDPRPFLISEAIFSNVGGTATMIGDPPNIIIGNLLSDDVDFTKFLINLAPGVLITAPFMFCYLWFIFREDLRGPLDADVPTLQQTYPITNRGLLVKCGVVLGCVILCFFLHPVTHVDPAFVSILGAVWLLIAFDMHHCHEALMAVEWDTLLFFAALFVVVEGVGELGLLRAIASILSDIVRSVPVDSRQIVAIVIIVWASAIFSAFVDNIPFTATMVPVLQQLVADVEGVSIRPLAWALAFGACFGGNGTLIGASANIVMASKAEVEGFPVTFISFIKIGFPAMLISVAFATCYLAAVNSIFYPWS